MSPHPPSTALEMIDEGTTRGTLLGSVGSDKFFIGRVEGERFFLSPRVFDRAAFRGRIVGRVTQFGNGSRIEWTLHPGWDYALLVPIWFLFISATSTLSAISGDAIPIRDLGLLFGVVLIFAIIVFAFLAATFDRRATLIAREFLAIVETDEV